jgi:endonuclease YncB( thermonuclease family)
LVLVIVAAPWARADEQMTRAAARANSPVQAAAQTEGAKSAVGAARPCRYGAAQTARVESIVDGRGLRLADGREVRLAGIEVPPLPRPGDSGAADATGRAAQAALAALVAGQPVVLRNLPAKPDRYGRFPALVFAGSDQRLVQEALLAQGRALVGVSGDPACRAALLAAEREARRGQLGLWADPYYDLKQADNPAGILLARGRFALVEGKVVSVRESGSTIYVNFGRRWSDDFTVTILKRNERLFSASGLAPKTLGGRRVRVRGWVEERGGPWIEAIRPEQIEIAEGN